MKTRVCSNCKQEKEESLVYFYRARSNRFNSWCKECCKKTSHQQNESGYSKPSTSPAKRRRRKKRCHDPLLSKVDELWGSARTRARQHGRGKPFLISREWVEEKVMEFCATNYHVFEPYSPFQPSLDKIDPKLPYTEENTRVIWKIENYAKNTFSDADVIEFCKRKLGIPIERKI